MSILTEPNEQEQDAIKGFNSEIAKSLGINAAVIIQQLHFWNEKGMGVLVNGRRYIYNTYTDWIDEQFKWLSKYQFRVWMQKLRLLNIVEVIQHRKKEYNRTNYYHLNYDRLYEYLGWSEAETTETVEMRKSTHREVNSSQIEDLKSAPSYTKNNQQRKQQRVTPTQEKETHSNFYEQETSDNYRPTLPQKTPDAQPKITSQVKTNSSEAVVHPSELRLFHQALIKGLATIGNIKSPDAVAKIIVSDVKAGVASSYWIDFKAGLPIGTSTKPEWEASPGVPFPKFINYLREKLAEPHDSPERALIRASETLNNRSLAQLLWSDFKRIVEGLSQDSDRSEATGKQSNIPSWFIDRADISVEQAGKSAERLNKKATNTDWVATKANLPVLTGTEFEPVPLENISINFGDWSGDLDYLIAKAKGITASPSKLSLWVQDFRAALNNATDRQKVIIKSAIAKYCPLMLEVLQT